MDDRKILSIKYLLGCWKQTQKVLRSSSPTAVQVCDYVPLLVNNVWVMTMLMYQVGADEQKDAFHEIITPGSINVWFSQIFHWLLELTLASVGLCPDRASLSEGFFHGFLKCDIGGFCPYSKLNIYPQLHSRNIGKCIILP